MLVPSLLLAAASHDLYTLSLHDALPILKALDTARSVDVGTVGSDQALVVCVGAGGKSVECGLGGYDGQGEDRKSTRLNSSHVKISYAVFCLKKKNQSNTMYTTSYQRRHR